ncbi:DUF742 domain-containing protein [Streptomyces collinus]|uniref:DUF742 domain-containing protein n=1 Tax=Streptomyces collinus TaxID=42684 RepID=UPI0037D33D80
MSPKARREPLPAESAEDTLTAVRLYTLTAGRTRPRHRLRLETVLEAGPGRPGPGMPHECGQILALCAQRRRSVTELAGTLGRPVNAVKILVSDLLDARALVVPVTASFTTDPSGKPRPSGELLEAALAGLKARWPDAYPKAV